VVLGIVLVVALVGWLALQFVRDRLHAAGCGSTTVLNVTAAPDIAPILTQAARKAAGEDSAACYRVDVSSRDSLATAESLAVSDGSDRPDLWIPESTMWLQRAKDKGAWQDDVTGTSIASSPVVLALTDAAATDLGWPARTLSWADVIGPGAKSLTVGFPDPARDPVGVSTLLGLRDLIRTSADPGGAGTAAMRKLSPNTVSQQSDLFDRLPGGTGAGEPLTAFPTSEVALLKHNVRQDGNALVAVYATPAVPALDYPYVELPGIAEAKQKVADRFRDRLINQDSSDALADAGFRTPDGKMLRDRSQDRRTSSAPMTPVPVPEDSRVEDVLNSWAAVNLSGRLLVLLDVSGSMNEPVPGTNLTRMAVTTQAAAQGLTLFKPSTKLGMWLFSTKLDGDKDYTVLLPVRTVAEQLAGGAVAKVKSVKAVPNGATGLYDTILAAYEDGRQNWEPGRINTIVILTDGRNEDPGGISLDQLLSKLGTLQDPRRPLRVIGIGIGPDIDPVELKRISDVTGGQAFTTADPTKIGDVFYSALNKLLGG
jgi:Mg-chelatase subunit ChlD